MRGKGTTETGREALAASEKLRDELSHARQALINLMPTGAHEVLMTLYGCQSREEVEEWRVQTVARLLALAQAKDPEALRCPCPLCGAAAVNAGRPGYAMPEGLHRHLGGHSTARSCPVMEAAIELARECADSPLKVRSFFD